MSRMNNYSTEETRIEFRIIFNENNETNINVFMTKLNYSSQS